MIFPDNFDFVVMTDGNCLHILVGSQEFIESVTSCKDVIKEFLEDLSEYFFTEEARKFLLSLVEKYPGINYLLSYNRQ